MSSRLADNERDAFIASLAELEESLRNNCLFIFAKLAPAATADDIATLRAGLGEAQIECLELWYQWHNGCEGHLTDLLPLGRMLSIAEALEDRQLTASVPFVDSKRKRALKMLEDGSGDGFFLDIASPRPRVFYHMLEDPYPRDYGTLPQFVTFLRDVHAAGIASENEHDMVSFDLDRYQQLEAEYLERVRMSN